VSITGVDAVEIKPNQLLIEKGCAVAFCALPPTPKAVAL
jgi:hypothetical protein